MKSCYTKDPGHRQDDHCSATGHSTTEIHQDEPTVTENVRKEHTEAQPDSSGPDYGQRR